MIQIDVEHSGSVVQCFYAGQELTTEKPLVLVRQKKTALQFRFVTSAGTADTEVTSSMLNVLYLALTSGTRELARTDSGITVSTDSDGFLIVDVAALVTDTETVRTFLGDAPRKGEHDGELCTLEFSSRNATTESALTLWFSCPVELLNPAKSTNSELPVEPATYLTAAETRIAAGEIVESYAISEVLTSCTFTPYHGKIYTKNLAANDTFTFTASAADNRCTFELYLTQPATAVSFSWGNSIWWPDEEGRFAATHTAPDFTEGNVVYRLAFQHDGTIWLGNLVSVKELA